MNDYGFWRSADLGYAGERNNSPFRTKPRSFAKFAKNEIMVFSMCVAAGTGCLPGSCQLLIGVIVSRETQEFPASRGGITFALPNHDIHATRLTFYGVASNLLGFQQVVDNH